VRLMCLQASLDGGRGFSDDARAKLDQALAMARAADDRALELIALNGLAAALLRQGQHDAAEALYTVALSIAQRLDDRRWLGGIHGNLGIIAHQRGDGAAAGTHYAAALAGVGEVGDRQWEGNMRCSYGLLLHEQGQSAAAQRELEAALSSARALGHRRLEATALCNLGIVLGALPAATSEALEPLAAAVLIAHDLADHGLESQFRGYLGLALAQAAKTLATEACFNEAFRLLDAIGGAPDAASRALLCCQRAEAAAVRGDAAALGQWAQAAEEAVAGEVAGGAPLHVAPTSELGRALDRVRQHRGVVGVSSPR